MISRSYNKQQLNIIVCALLLISVLVYQVSVFPVYFSLQYCLGEIVFLKNWHIAKAFYSMRKRKPYRAKCETIIKLSVPSDVILDIRESLIFRDSKLHELIFRFFFFFKDTESVKKTEFSEAQHGKVQYPLWKSHVTHEKCWSFIPGDSSSSSGCFNIS